MLDDKVNGRSGVGSMLQLTAKSDIDERCLYALSESPTDLPFKCAYKQHTTFDKHPSELFPESRTARLGDTLVFRFDVTKCDLVGNLVLRVPIHQGLPEGHVWENDLGCSLIESVTVTNGDRVVWTASGTSLFTYFALHTPSSRWAGLCRMLRRFNSSHSLHGRPVGLVYVPIPFLVDQFFPSFIANQRTFVVRVKLSPVERAVRVLHETLRVNFVNYQAQGRVGVLLRSNIDTLRTFDQGFRMRPSLLYDAFFLSEAERIMFRQPKPQHLVYRRTQEIVHDVLLGQTNTTCRLDLVGNVSHLVVTLAAGVDRPLIFYPLKSIQLALKGYEGLAVDARRYRHFNRCARTPSNNVYVVPFALCCASSPQPSGTHPFTGLKDKSFVKVAFPTALPANRRLVVQAVTVETLTFQRGQWV